MCILSVYAVSVGVVRPQAVMTGRVCESRVLYFCSAQLAVRFTRYHASRIVIGSRKVVIGHLFSDRLLIQRPLMQPLIQRPLEPEFFFHHLFSD